MKKILFLFIFLLQVIITNAQAWVYHPFPYTNAEWKYKWIDGCPTNPSIGLEYNYQDELFGDTIIFGKKYAKVYSKSMVWSPPCTVHPSFTRNLSCGIRNDTANKKVFITNFVYPEDLLYDFNLTIGDTVPQTFQTIINIDSVLVGGSYRKRYSTSVGDTIIEGIGGVIEDFIYHYSGPHLSPYIYFLCYTNNSTLYTSTIAAYNNWGCPTIENIVSIAENEMKEDEITISPNPFTSQTTISFSEEQKSTTIKIMDIAGRKVDDKTITVNGKSTTLDMSNYAKGIYFLEITDVNKNIANKKIVIQ